MRTLDWRLNGKRKYEYDGYLFILQNLSAALYKPEAINGSCNPYSTDTVVELSETQQAAKREFEQRVGMKMFGKFLSQFKRKRKNV